jgi:hypothetical protein
VQTGRFDLDTGSESHVPPLSHPRSREKRRYQARRQTAPRPWGDPLLWKGAAKVRSMSRELVIGPGNEFIPLAQVVESVGRRGTRVSPTYLGIRAGEAGEAGPVTLRAIGPASHIT